MSIYRIGSDAWEIILGYLDASDTIRLILSGDTTLRTLLKPAFRDFVVSFATIKSSSLSSLLTVFKDSSMRPRRFSISRGQHHFYYKLDPEDYTAGKWKKLFPLDLESLELDVWSAKQPVSSLLECLETVAPRLKKLCIEELPRSALSLPRNLTFLEIGHFEAGADKLLALKHSNIIESLPTTLTHLKFFPKISLISEIASSNLPFKKMPLALLHGNFTFRSLTKEQACWSILPNTISDLSVELYYGREEAVLFEPPRNHTWKQLFPSLTSLNVLLESFVEASLFQDSDDLPDGEISNKEIENVRSMFPTSLTALNVRKSNNDEDVHFFVGLPLVVCALGEQLRSYEFGDCIYSASALEWIPKWQNPKVELVEVHVDDCLSRYELSEDEKIENFGKKNHPFSKLYRNATSLDTTLIPASGISFLPKTTKTLEFEVATGESLTMESALKVSKRLGLCDDSINTEEFSTNLYWTMLGWPPALTTLKIDLKAQRSLHLGCLPATLKELVVNLWSSAALDLEGGDLTHLTELSTFQLYGRAPRIFTSLHSLPRSLRSITAIYSSINSIAFEDPAFEKFFSNLEILDLLRGCQCDANILLHIPQTLKEFHIYLKPDGSHMSEKHFEAIFRSKLVFLRLHIAAKWPKELKADVFSRFMPPTLAYLDLFFVDGLDGEFQQELVEHIPKTLLQFASAHSELHLLVQTGITKAKNKLTSC